MDHKGTFGGVDEFTDFGALGLVCRQEAMRVVVLFTKTPEELGQIMKRRQ